MGVLVTRPTRWTKAEIKSFSDRGYPLDMVWEGGPTDADRVLKAREAIRDAITQLCARRFKGRVACPGTVETKSALKALNQVLKLLRARR